MSNNQTAGSSAAETAKRLKVLLQPLKDERADAARLDELRRLFAQQDMSPSSSTSGQSSETIQKWKSFLQTHLDLFVAQLMQRMERRTAVRTFWGVIAACPSYTRQHTPYVSQSLLQKWFRSMPQQSGDKALRQMVESEFLHQYIDVQYYAYIALAQLAMDQYNRDKMNVQAASLLFQLLTMLPRLKSQHEIDTGTYLFQPPTSGKPEDEDDEDSDSEDEDVEHSNQDEDESDTDSDNDEPKPAAKKRKQEPKLIRVFQYQQIRAHRKVMGRAWFAILKLALPMQDLKHALQVLPTQVLPFVPNPLRFADFFVQAYGDHQGGVIPILALDGLFLLMMDHGLEYPHFYGSLYRLVQPSLFYVKYRIRFFELLIKCLTKNDMLPAHLVAAFCKRLLRASLSAPPAACLFALALTSNLLRKHPECACLIHRSDGGNGDWPQDKFDAETQDPTKSHALESSLWECHVLANHYFPAVATLAQSIGQEEGPLHDMTDFLSHTYKTLFDQERKQADKKRKKVPLAFHKPVSLFGEQDVFGGMIQSPEI